MKVATERSIKSVNTRILIVLNDRSLLLLNNPIKCHFGIREKVSLMTGKGLSVRQEESILVMETRGINMETTSLQTYWRVWEEIRMLTLLFERKTHKYCSPKCNLLKCFCFYQISGDHFKLDCDNKHTTYSDISYIRTHLHTRTHNRRVLHLNCPVSRTTFQLQNVIQVSFHSLIPLNNETCQIHLYSLAFSKNFIHNY